MDPGARAAGRKRAAVNEFRHGLMVGKFYPPHIGHHGAIRAAAARCDAFSVLVMASAVETVPLADRVAWLREEHAGDVNVRVTGIRCDAPLDVTDQRVWAAQVAVMRAGIGTGAVDVVFSGDDYCTELARWFDAKAVLLDRAGSSTAVRGTIRRCMNICLVFVALSVMPAMAVNSGADSVVDTAIMRMASTGGSIGRARSAGAPLR